MDSSQPPQPPQPPDGNASEYWSSVYAADDHYGRETYWLAIPEVHDRYQAKATRNQSESWIDFVVKEYLETEQPAEAILSVGCGTGALERHLAARGVTAQIEGIDISQVAVEKARQAASASNLSYRVADMETLALAPKHYDAVIFNSSFHHLLNMERVCERLQSSLKPGGCLILNEYVGANRFDFPDRQKEAMHAAFMLIPPRYRRSCERVDFGRVRETMEFPNPTDVAALDETEAARSADIPALVHHYFDVVEENPCGGSLLQFVLNGIAGNFTTDNPNAQRILHMLFDVEDALLDSGDLSSDFVLMVARVKS